MGYESIMKERGDREWRDGDDSGLYESGYMDGTQDGFADGVLAAYDYVIEELGLDISDSDLLPRLINRAKEKRQ